MEMKQVDVIGAFEALKTKGEARLSDFATPIDEKKEETGLDYNQFQPIEDMNEVTPIFKKIFDGGKTYGTESIKMGFYKESPMIAKVDGNVIEFALPFNGAMAMLREFLKRTHFNKTDSIMCVVEVNDDNTMLTATFYSKEYKLFMDL
jgi:hypothetical protein